MTHTPPYEGSMYLIGLCLAAASGAVVGFIFGFALGLYGPFGG